MDRQVSFAESILAFIHATEALKRELRHSWLSNGRQESVADHTWRTCLMALLLHKQLASPVVIGVVLKMLLVHDLVEMYAGDVPVFEQGIRMELKQQREKEAMARIVSELGPTVGPEIEALWLNFEERESPEARFATALDKLEAQIQHNAAAIETWLPAERDRVFSLGGCDFDPFLQSFLDSVRQEAIRKMNAT